MVEDNRVKSWAALHNKLDNLYKYDNHELPTLAALAERQLGQEDPAQFRAQPLLPPHRQSKGVQLPYIDVVEMEIVAPGLVAAKANAGETDLQGRGLAFRDASILKKGEEVGNYKTRLWKTGVASQIAIYPNLNFADDGLARRSARCARATCLVTGH